MKVGDNKKIFDRYKVKNTKQRNGVYDVLKESEQPLSADQIFLKVREGDDSVSISTVYRILDVFQEREMVMKTTMTAESKALYELNRMEHKHYLICSDCKKVVPVEGCPLEGFEKRIESHTRFQISGHKLELYGKCWDCRP